MKLLEAGEFEKRVEALFGKLASCEVCMRKCHVNRLEDSAGWCRIGRKAKVASATKHHGEEPPISGSRGSGTIFFSGCNLRCAYCQNYDISQEDVGRETDDETLAGYMLSLQADGAHNINFVSPSHVVPQAFRALLIAARKGLRIPVVYNSNGYDSVEVLRLLDGLVDIYMPDIKYADDKAARKYSSVSDYVSVSRAAIKEMQRQVGDLRMDEAGVAARGLLVRHLVLPEGLAGTESCLRFLVNEVSPDIFLSLMAQYHPCYRADEFPEISRRVTPEEYKEAVSVAETLGIRRGFFQGMGSADIFLPDFKRDEPFE